ncbi:hypothetical protein CISG_07664 [Coccidioides immitis RMSCC 3703]|uniref:Uncharacterized protein n=2 Tax=Coccidioides immitis TaxID=5501 RepID=A0A0J8R687_COCIT|nr:hypothetical protein CIRG_02850 [Coccidioides immitis RMSCC 2394]KMU79233.1 hypothetical protein CISG_07664 [Coccidioides immitis RMSCC 3703]
MEDNARVCKSPLYDCSSKDEQQEYPTENQRYISKKEDKCFVSKLRGISIPFTVPFEASKAASLVSSAQAGQPMLSRDLRALVWTLGWRSYTSRTSNHRSLARNTAKPNADW